MSFTLHPAQQTWNFSLALQASLGPILQRWLASACMGVGGRWQQALLTSTHPTKYSTGPPLPKSRLPHADETYTRQQPAEPMMRRTHAISTTPHTPWTPAHSTWATTTESLSRLMMCVWWYVQSASPPGKPLPTISIGNKTLFPRCRRLPATNLAVTGTQYFHTFCPPAVRFLCRVLCAESDRTCGGGLARPSGKKTRCQLAVSMHLSLAAILARRVCRLAHACFGGAGAPATVSPIALLARFVAKLPWHRRKNVTPMDN